MDYDIIEPTDALWVLLHFDCMLTSHVNIFVLQHHKVGFYKGNNKGG